MKNIKKNKSKPKYKFGAFLKQNAEPISQVAGLAGQLINTEDPSGAAASGALQGVGAGAAFGPAGAIVGGLVGGATSLLGAEEAQRRKKEMQQQRENMITGQLMSNAGNAYAKGGKLNNLSSKLGVVQGGELEPISKDAVEVKANNPNQTDSVELDQAYVDHNEVIDRKNRVFSDELGFAKLAKKLEKQKSKSSRFTASNERIEQQLDNLFQEQESMKKGMKKGGKYKMLTGGELTEPGNPNPIDISKLKKSSYLPESPDSAYLYDPNKVKRYTRADFLDNKIPSEEVHILNQFKNNKNISGAYSGSAYRQDGAEFPNMLVDIEQAPPTTLKKLDGSIVGVGQNQGDFVSNAPKFKTGGRLQLNGAMPMQPLKKKLDVGGKLGSINKLKFGEKLGENPLKSYKYKAQPKSNKLDINKGITQAATFVPNIASAIGQNSLKGPATPQLEATTRLQRMSANDQLAEADRQGLLADQLIKNNTAQGADIASATGNILAKKLASKNQIYGENQRVNAAIQGQEAALNTQIKARNTERVNQFNNDTNDFSNLKTRLTTDNVSNLSSKILQQGREKNQMDLDKFKTKYNSFKFEDSGVADRVKQKLLGSGETEETLAKMGLKSGGKIHIKPENKGKFNATKKRTGKSTEELTHNKNPKTRKRAVFAQNAAKWNKK